MPTSLTIQNKETDNFLYIGEDRSLYNEKFTNRLIFAGDVQITKENIDKIINFLQNIEC